MKSIFKAVSLCAVCAFQFCAGSAIVALLVHDLAAGRFHGWHIAAAVTSGLALGLGGVATSFVYGVLAVRAFSGRRGE